MMHHPHFSENKLGGNFYLADLLLNKTLNLTRTNRKVPFTFSFHSATCERVLFDKGGELFNSGLHVKCCVPGFLLIAFCSVCVLCFLPLLILCVFSCSSESR